MSSTGKSAAAKADEMEVNMLGIIHGVLFTLIAALTLLGCDSSDKAQDQKRAPAQASREVVKVATGETPPPDALAKVGDRYVRFGDYEKQLARLSPKLSESEHGRKYVINQVVENLLIEKEAEARGLTQDPAVLAKIEDFSRNLYRNTLMQRLKEGQLPISDEEAKKYFLEREDEFVQPERARISLIQLPPDKEKEINAIHRELRAGKDFAELARVNSKHVSAARGGDLGFLSRKQFKELTDVAFAVKAGEISKPFKSPSGWAIIKVHEIVKKQEIPIEEGVKRAKARMEAMETAKLFEDLMKNLRAKNQVLVYEDQIKKLQP
jgi:parvulin-like peptidyl-prolyl isomerase